ncbi:cytosine permease [Paenibacillus gallinarum]|uniref:Cytosine permease n=1 Tax=Paenibacillus gallinarum TaxID=2762232 RepID=A0ABR8T3S3_9BACL|nr:cytosine permease [Paenibacillus gallinarum]MBD7970430.1 cytosine permease [Paenibacillus gallinarum]
MREHENQILEEEYENSAVPAKARKSLFSVSMIWIGFPMIMTSAVTGATIIGGLGFWTGMLSILIGNLILFGYVGALAMLSANKGYNFSLQSAITFGSKGARVVSGLLSTLVIGWFAVQTGMTGSSMHDAFGSNAFLITFIASVLFIVLTLFGVKALTYIGAVSAPFFFLIGLWAVHDATKNIGFSSITGFQGTGMISMGLAVTMVISLFADSGTMTADFNRWSKNKKQALASTFTAFPLACMIAMVFGGLIAATASQNSDLFLYIAGKGGMIAYISKLLLFLNLGSVCAHCLYNASVGWSSLTGRKMRETAVVLGVIGTIFAVSGAWNHFFDWLNLLGIIVPPIGAVILCDQLFLRRKADISQTVRISAFAAWVIGAFIGLIVDQFAPFLSTAVMSMLAGGVAYTAIMLAKTSFFTPAEPVKNLAIEPAQKQS